ncbi:hypothetical protein SUGI_0124610 [Cryptomeria japonica]|nr:hypothetical protein SUGI_0124610 [Cryptomeria japonica]
MQTDSDFLAPTYFKAHPPPANTLTVEEHEMKGEEEEAEKLPKEEMKQWLLSHALALGCFSPLMDLQLPYPFDFTDITQTQLVNTQPDRFGCVTEFAEGYI